MFSCCKIRGILVFITILILKCDTKRQRMREDARPAPRDYRPSKWVANSAMDIWYGNKSSIDVISREFADIMYKLTARPVRSILRYRSEHGKNITKKQQEVPSKLVSRVEINFINSKNNTFHTIKLQPMKQVNDTVFKVLEPLLGME